MQLAYSIIIPSFNSSSALIRCLNAIHRELTDDGSPYEIIVVESSPSIPELPNIPNLKLKYSKERLYPSEARNFGAKLAQAPVLIFIDADVELLPGAFQHISKGIKNGYLVVSGIYEYNNPYTGWISTLQDLSIFYRNSIVEKNQMNLSGRCFAIQAEAYWDVGGFSENLITYEDAELVLKLRNKNYRSSFMDLRCRSFHLKEYNPFSIFMDYYIKATNMIAYRLTCENNLRGSEYCFSLGLSISYGISLLYILLTVALPFSGDTLPLNSWMLTIAILISLDLICMCKFIKFTQQETHDWKLVIGSIAFFKLTIIPISLAFVNVLFLIFSRNKSFLNIKPAKGSL